MNPLLHCAQQPEISNGIKPDAVFIAIQQKADNAAMNMNRNLNIKCPHVIDYTRAGLSSGIEDEEGSRNFKALLDQSGGPI